MIKVGLTGGIGSGKTFISGLFEHLKIPCYNADLRAKELYVVNDKLKAKMIGAFGQDVYINPNKINKEYLKKVVFSSAKNRERINAIVHPFVIEDFNLWVKQQQNVPYIIKESALLIETGLYRELDKIILVTAPIELRIQRIAERDKTDIAGIKQKIAAQFSDEEKKKFADFLIINDGKKLLLPQVISIHNKLLDIARWVSHDG